MKPLFFLFIINFLCINIYAQVSETFSDTVLNPSTFIRWYGQVNDFKINSDHQLQSQGTIKGSSYLYTPIPVASSMEWLCWIKLGFAPSETNKLRIYLQSNDSLFSKGNAYYFELGDNGSADAVKFYRQSAGKPTLIAEGTAGAVANDPVLIRIKVNKSASGLWSFGVDYKGGYDFVEEWTINDSFKINDLNQYFGIECIYTSTRKDKFLFDDIFIHRDTIDHTPLRINHVDADSNTVSLFFNKAVDSVSAHDEENYVVSNGVGQPIKARKINDTVVILTFARNLQPGDYEIICKTFKEQNGSITTNLRAKWKYILNAKINPYDLLITELMIDPTPVLRLPGYEYIEVKNRSNHDIDLGNVTLKFENNRYSFDTSALILPAGEYLILCEEGVAYENLKSFGKIWRLKKWPTLRNTDGTIALYDSRDALIHQVVYDDHWYQDPKKKDGGWSLEMINPDNVCDHSMNWKASGAVEGGTPGKVNSVQDITFRIPLSADSLVFLNDRTLSVYFNKAIQLSPFSSFVFSPTLNINSVSIDGSSPRINLGLAMPLSSGVLYSLRIALHDCIDRPMDLVDTIIAKIEPVEKNDLVISEILFNPTTGGSDFVELFNRSKKILAPDNMIISNEITGKQQSIRNKNLILPLTFWVISPDPEFIKLHYTVPHPNQVISNTLPTLPDDHGQVSIWSKDKVLIDSCTYDQSYHYDFLNTRDGVTLERIDLESLPIATNWHSASGTSGYGTPTDKNSSAKPSSAIPVSRFYLKTNVFSPNDDGVDDLMLIQYEVADNNYIARIDIYDDQGRPIKKLASNLSIAYSGSIDWDGRDSKGRKCPVGIYIFAIHAIHTSGLSFQERLACVLN